MFVSKNAGDLISDDSRYVDKSRQMQREKMKACEWRIKKSFPINSDNSGWLQGFKKVLSGSGCFKKILYGLECFFLGNI